MLLRLLLEKEPSSFIYNLMMFMIKSDELVKKKYLAKCERLFLREKNILPAEG